MKAHFKYAFLTDFYLRGAAFAVIFIMDFVFIALGAAGLLPLAAQITAVSLGGVAISVMLVFNVIGDISIAKRMLSAPDAYLYALTPAPRWKTLLASVTVMCVTDIITMAAVITGETWLSLNLTGDGVRNTVQSAMNRMDSADWLLIVFGLLLLIAGYLLFLITVLLAVTARRSIFYKLPGSGFLAFLLACACIYAVSLTWLVFLPFGAVFRIGIFMTITVNSWLMPWAALLTLIEAAGLFVLTSKLMERKMNI